jgi:LacI family transcriptional regulator
VVYSRDSLHGCYHATKQLNTLANAESWQIVSNSLISTAMRRQPQLPRLGSFRSTVTHRVAIAHTEDTLEAWDFCRGVASYRPRSGPWGLRSIPMRSNSSPPYLRRLSETACDGMIMMPGRRQTLEALHQRGVKVVEVYGDGEGDRVPYPRIRIDNRCIGQLAGEHLLQRGFVRVIYLGVRSDWSRDRASALKQVVTDAGGQCHCIFARDWLQLQSETWISKQLQRIARPFAVMGCNDRVAACTVRAVNATQSQIPTEIGVIGVDDRITECIGVEPPLSSISIERFRIGHEAARLLDELFLGKSDCRRVHFFRPQRVTERESTSSYVYENPDVAAAIAYIHREACNGVTIEDVVSNGNLSRRTLERRFSQVVGRSPGDEIRRVRLEAVMHAIERTSLPLADIAAQCGFSCLSSLSHSFRQATGMSPQAYRKTTRSGGAAQ